MSDFDEWLIDYTVTDSFCMSDITTDMKFAFNAGRESMKADILAMLNTCLDRDPTLQKLVKQIEDMS